MREKIESLATVVLMVAAATMVGVYLSDRSRTSLGIDAVAIQNWEQHNNAGIRLGSADAPVVITEFMDFTCPHCRNLVPVVDSLYQSFPNEVALVFLHYPIRGRPFSMELAVAAECAAEQHQFWEMYRVIYSQPAIQSLDGLYTLAAAAQVPDLEEFSNCLIRPHESFSRIIEGRRIGEGTGVPGTPWVWLNGTPVSSPTYHALVKAAEKQGVRLKGP
ncbi:MAG TPA: thioredoxin domain-containing protein [Longimicrobiales bacterium]|nr:thioredoxin domain-containing protein [Longimicrobiales bacterium]